MARTGLDEQQVFQAADGLATAGEEPTVSAIRDKLGTGSFATISRHLKQWREMKTTETPVPKAPEAFLVAMKQIWISAWREAESAFETQKQAVALEQEKWLEEKKQMLAEIEKLEMDHAGSLARVKELEKVIERIEGERRRVEGEFVQFRQDLIRSQTQNESTLERLKETTARADRLEGELAAIAKAQAHKSKS